MNNTDRNIIIRTKGMDGSLGYSRIRIHIPYGRANSFEIFSHQRDFIDDVIDLLLVADSVYELKKELKKLTNQ